jgi:hypothetical protein
MVLCYLFCRRLKRWIFEKQQKGAQGTRRHRHRSVGDAETNLPKNKKQQQQFAQAIQVRTLLKTLQDVQTKWAFSKKCL